MKPTLQLSFDSLSAMHRFLEKIIPVVDDGTLKESTIQTLKSGLEYKEQQEPAPVPVPVPAPVPAPAPTPVAPQPVPVAAPAPAPVAPQQTTLQDALQATAPAPVTPAPAVAATYTVDDLSRAAVSLVDAGRQPELMPLLQKYGVISLPELPPEQYAAFAADLRALGAQI